MKKQMHLYTIISLCLLIACTVVTVAYDNEIFYSLAITFGTISYHLTMRLIVGWVVNTVKHNQFDYTKSWFQKCHFEDALYKRLALKSWKVKVPTYNPEFFDIRQRSIKEIVMATCQAEVVHEIIIILSFIPILFSVKFGALWVFIITSFAAAGIDLVFVLLQRFNRPRLMKLMR